MQGPGNEAVIVIDSYVASISVSSNVKGGYGSEKNQHISQCCVPMHLL